MRMTFTMSSLALVLLAGVASAQEVNVVHYWTSAAESKAMGALASAYKAAGGTWVDNAVGSFDDAKAMAISRISGGDGPSALLTTPGGALDELATSGLLRDMSDIATAEGWESRVPPLVWKSMQSDGKVVAVPMGMHADNWIWYSKPLFAELGLKQPTNWDEIFATADKINASGKVGLAIGGEPWQIAYIFVDQVIGVGGADLYEQLFVKHNAEAAISEQTISAFRLLRKASSYADPGSTGRSWNDTTGMVVTGKAGMQFMGDWAKGEFAAAGKVGGTDYGCFLAPSSGASPYVIVLDVLAFPKPDSKDEAAGQAKLASLAMSADVATSISSAKGSVPALNTVKAGTLDYCGAIGAKAAANDKVLPSFYSSLSSDQQGQLTDLIGQFWTNKDMSAEDAAKALAGILAKG